MKAEQLTLLDPAEPPSPELWPSKSWWRCRSHKTVARCTSSSRTRTRLGRRRGTAKINIIDNVKAVPWQWTKRRTLSVLNFSNYGDWALMYFKNITLILFFKHACHNWTVVWKGYSVYLRKNPALETDKLTIILVIEYFVIV